MKGETAAILGALGDGLFTSAAIGARIGMSTEDVSSRLCELTRRGLVRRAGAVPQRIGKPLVAWALAARPSAGPTPPPDDSGLSLTARLLGDPLPGRSALDLRGPP